MDIESLGIRGVKFQNWARTFSCSPDLYFAPKTPNEIRQILAFANNQSRKVRVVGGGHSPSDLVCCEDYMISLQHFKSIEVYATDSQVRVGAGVQVATLNEFLIPHNLSLSTLGSVSEVTLAGAISTGTHGSGISFGNMCTFVVELELMKSNGELIHCSRSHQSDLFLAATCGLGAFGIILSVVYQCEPRFHLERRDSPSLLGEVLDQLPMHLGASDHFHFHWYPHSEYVNLIHASRTDKPETKLTWWGRWSNWFWNYIVGFHGLEFAYWLGTFWPSLTGIVNRLTFQLLFSTPKSYIGQSHKVLSMECRFKQYVTEWAIHLDKTGLALLSLKQWLEEHPEVYAHLAVEVRFVKADDFYLSPAYGRETCYINIIMYKPYNREVPFKAYWEAYETIMRNCGGRPHWAKAHNLRGKDLKTLYPKWNAWCLIREKVDPTNMFVNSYLDRILSYS